MPEHKLAEHLDSLASEREQDGVLFRKALTEAYLLGRVPRETVLAALGQEELELIERQRDALLRDVEWAAQGA